MSENPNPASPLTLDDVYAFAHWHHFNELAIYDRRTPSDTEIEFEAEALKKIEAALIAHEAFVAELQSYAGQLLNRAEEAERQLEDIKDERDSLAEDADDFWETYGFPNNRKHLTIAQQSASTLHELDVALNPEPFE